jgi:pyruvate,water dikinase
MGYVQWLHRGPLARETAGGKGASLSEMLAAGFSVPLGFVVAADAYRRFADANGLDGDLASRFEGLDPRDAGGVRAACQEVRSRLEGAPLPADLREEVVSSYTDLCSMAGVAAAVRSSAVSEDGAGASFAGLYESYLNRRGPAEVLAALLGCYASLWSERAVRYRLARGADPAGEAMAVVVMGLVHSETSGIAFTAHPVTGERDRVVINSSWGLGEAIVSGRVTPDSFVVEKESLALLERDIYEKELAIYPHPDAGGTIEVRPDCERAAAPSLRDDEAREVARLAVAVERHFGSPQDVEWGKAGGQVYLLQSRPITTLA